MCLAIPGEIKSIDEATKIGKVDFDGVTRDVPMELVPSAKVGDYVLVHAGFAIEVMSADEAKITLDILDDMKAAENDIAQQHSSAEGDHAPQV